MSGPYRVVVADPAWPFGDKLPGKSRGAAKNYRAISLGDLGNFLIDHGIEVADDAVLFLWRVAAMQEEALKVMRDWEFHPKAELVWLKLTQGEESKPWFGMGRIFRNAHEVCLVGKRGQIQPKSKSVRSVLATNVEDGDLLAFTARVGSHSEKPNEFFQIVEELYDGPYIELFARKHRPGWDAIGDELPINT